MSAATFQEQVVEYFTLRQAARTVALVPEETRASAYRDLRVAFQKREAAETLWPRGSTAEALRLAVDGLDRATASLDAFGVEPAPAWLDRARAIASDAKKKLADAKVPALEREMATAQEETFRAVVEALLSIEECAGVSFAAPAELVRIRNARIVAWSAGAIVALGALGFWLHTPMFTKATASAQYGDTTPDRVFDGDPSTGWFLPDHTPQGWIELTLGKPRPLKTLHILSSNPPNNDRAAKDARIDAMLGDQVVKSLDTTFPEPQGREATWTDVKLDAPKSDRLRITLKSGYKLGPGIDEISIK